MGWLGRASLMRRFRERPKGAKGASHAEISINEFSSRGERAGGEVLRPGIAKSI